MSVTRVQSSERERCLGQIDKLVHSQVLHGSESLCKLLRYLAEHAIDHPGSSLKEYQIATEVFGRPTDFDPQVDSTIRVQAGRLRSKLTEYYGSEGAEDPVFVELPKGTYVLAFHRRATDHRAHSNETFHHERRSWLSAFIVVSILLAASLVAIAALIMSRKPIDPAHASEPEPVPLVLQLFWNPFVTAPEEPWVNFSNAAFIGRPETGMRYYDAAHDPRDRIWDHYTGVGEVLAVHNLDQMFGF